MDKLEMKTKSISQENIEKIRAMFPNAVTEIIKGGKVTLAVDFDVLKQELSECLIAEGQERYQMTWPDKKKSVVLANSAISATLRPCKEESVDFDTTQNLYIEGDNLDVLKLLRETYLGKVKMIYIDPPYNTGNDFIYNDDFSQDSDEYLDNSGQYDEQGNRLFQNTESNGRFHTDWLNMIYPRLKVAKDLLADDGAIFVSIDEHEHSNLLMIMNEIFGSSNYIDSIVWEKKAGAKGVPPRNLMVNVHEYIVAYQKSDSFKFFGEKRDTEGFKNPDNDPRGPWRVSNIKSTTKPIEEAFTIVDPNTGKEYTNTWAFSKQSLERMIREGRILWKESLPKQKEYLYEMTNENKAIKSSWGVFDAQSTTVFLKNLLPTVHFDNPKPINLMKYLLSVVLHRGNDIVVDFFSGSATTAHAVMQLNAEDGGRRKFIMVQLPEICDEKSEAYKAGYKNICEIGKERIRRAGKKIKEELREEGMLEMGLDYMSNLADAENNADIDSVIRRYETLDIGFRVLKLDSSNMQDVFYNPSAMTQSLLDSTVDNVKPNRTAMDLLFQVMLELGVELSAKIEEKEIQGKKYYIVNGNEIIACFDDNLNNEVITEIAKLQPLYAVFKDKSFATDSVGINNEQIFKTYAPSTTVKVI